MPPHSSPAIGLRGPASDESQRPEEPESVQHFIATYGYAAIFLLMLLESA
jgi:hypothetical protein